MEKTCYICEKNNACYKCPTCRISYCSVVCYKQHKTETCEPPKAANKDKESQDNTINKQYFFPTEDTVPVHLLQQLRFDVDVMKHLRNPHVRDIMKAILSDENPTAAIALSMTDPSFVELADACLNIVEKPDEDKPC